MGLGGANAAFALDPGRSRASRILSDLSMAGQLSRKLAANFLPKTRHYGRSRQAGLANTHTCYVISRALLKGSLPSHCVSRHTLRVRFGETDLMGVVHHGTYISYFEVGRVEYMRRRGLDYNSWTSLGIHLPVVEVNIRYRRTARFDELLCIETRLADLQRVQMRFDYRLLRPEASNGNGGEELVAEGFTTLACVGHDHVLRRVPQDADAILRGPELTEPRPEPEVSVADRRAYEGVIPTSS